MREMSPAFLPVSLFYIVLHFVLMQFLSLCSFCPYAVGFGDGKIIGGSMTSEYFFLNKVGISCQHTWWMALRQNVEVMGSCTALQPQSRGTIYPAGSSCQSSSRVDWKKCRYRGGV